MNESCTVGAVISLYVLYCSRKFVFTGDSANKNCFPRGAPLIQITKRVKRVGQKFVSGINCHQDDNGKGFAVAIVHFIRII